MSPMAGNWRGGQDAGLSDLQLAALEAAAEAWRANGEPEVPEGAMSVPIDALWDYHVTDALMHPGADSWNAVLAARLRRTYGVRRPR